MANAHEGWIAVAQLLRPQGRHGELLAEPHADPALLVAGSRLWLAAREDSMPFPEGARELEGAWQPTGRNKGRWVLKLSGTDSISAADLLVGQFLLLPLSALPPLASDTFRVRDLLGCALYDGDRHAGTVVDVQFPVAADGRTRLEDAPDLLVVEPSMAIAATTVTAAPPREPETVLVPFVQAWLIGVDLAAKRIAMHLPPGLFTLSDAAANDATPSDAAPLTPALEDPPPQDGL